MSQLELFTELPTTAATIHFGAAEQKARPPRRDSYASYAGELALFSEVCATPAFAAVSGLVSLIAKATHLGDASVCYIRSAACISGKVKLRNAITLRYAAMSMRRRMPNGCATEFRSVSAAEVLALADQLDAIAQALYKEFNASAPALCEDLIPVGSSRFTYSASGPVQVRGRIEYAEDDGEADDEDDDEDQDEDQDEKEAA